MLLIISAFTSTCLSGGAQPLLKPGNFWDKGEGRAMLIKHYYVKMLCLLVSNLVNLHVYQ